ncbi:dTMP kinase [candidate division LCP-89 bacterium B3_LCP]|uniref:Thymidylate kinase n=1 Tax=candidate division LCP-89 bacterium B3_LCP TaxID=2012998 RepID=A0A532V5V8_UNCL8|nr:MAG: dTMP kinase [candidate division LCP-89 bacterium B3_LCP]
MNNTGKLIVYEGIDGSGKTTQLQRSAEWLSSRKYLVRTYREPTSGPHGQKLRQSASTGRLSAEEEMNLFLRDREWNVTTRIRPALSERVTVLLDRYYYSSIAYQGARGLDTEMIRDKNRKIAQEPDLVLLFDLDPEMAIDRIRASRGDTPNLFEKIDYLKKVRAIFLSLTDPNMVRIDASEPIDTVWQQVEEALASLFPHP